MTLVLEDKNWIWSFEYKMRTGSNKQVYWPSSGVMVTMKQ